MVLTVVAAWLLKFWTEEPTTMSTRMVVSIRESLVNSILEENVTMG